MRAEFQHSSQSRESVRTSIADSILPAASSLNVLVLHEWLHYPPNVGRGVRTWSLPRRLVRHPGISARCNDGRSFIRASFKGSSNGGSAVANIAVSGACAVEVRPQ